MARHTWTLLLCELPTKQNAQRVSLWRKLKKLGAITLKTSAYLLPDMPSHHESFQWLAQQVRDGGGQASLIRATEIEGLSEADIVELFNEARSKDYAELRAPLSQLTKQRKRLAAAEFDAQFDKLRARYEEIHSTDFFRSPVGEEVLAIIESAAAVGKIAAQLPKLSPSDYKGKTWLTRPQPEVDRVASAWLLRKFIDPKARFIFAPNKHKHPNAISYDMLDADFTHHGDSCTFEVLVHRFGVTDPTALRIAQMVHAADLNDGKYAAPEALGIHCVLLGLAALGKNDAQILAHGLLCFDALYASLNNKT